VTIPLLDEADVLLGHPVEQVDVPDVPELAPLGHPAPSGGQAP
jgi:hypothetical protein